MGGGYKRALLGRNDDDDGDDDDDNSDDDGDGDDDGNDERELAGKDHQLFARSLTAADSL